MTSTKTLTAPRTTLPGLVHLHNAGAPSFYIYRLRHGGLDTFVQDFNSSSPNGLLRDFFAVDHAPSRGDVYATLPAATYYLVDGDVFPIDKSWVATMKVRGPTSNASAPVRAQPISINSSDTLGVPAALSTTAPIRIALASHHDQVVWLYHVGSAVSEKTIADFVAHPSPAKYSELEAKTPVELAAIDGPQTIWTSWKAPAGRYVIFNLAYGPTGHLYFAHGQARRLTVT